MAGVYDSMKIKTRVLRHEVHHVPADYDNRISDSQWEAQVLRAGRRIPGLGIPHRKKGVVDLYDVSDAAPALVDATYSLRCYDGELSGWPRGPRRQMRNSVHFAR